MRHVRALTVVSCLVIGLALPATAAAVFPIPIPATARAAADGMRFTLAGGNRLTISFDQTKRGKRLARQVIGRKPTVRCIGLDVTNRTAYDLIGAIRWPRSKKTLNVRLKQRIVPDACSVGTNLDKMTYPVFRIVDAYPYPKPPADARYATQFASLRDVVSAAYEALDQLNARHIVNPNSQQLVDQLGTSRSFHPPLPLVALTSASQFVDPTMIGIWTDADEVRANQMLEDSTELSDVLMYPGITR